MERKREREAPPNGANWEIYKTTNRCRSRGRWNESARRIVPNTRRWRESGARGLSTTFSETFPVRLTPLTAAVHLAISILEHLRVPDRATFVSACHRQFSRSMDVFYVAKCILRRALRYLQISTITLLPLRACGTISGAFAGIHYSISLLYRQVEGRIKADRA